MKSIEIEELLVAAHPEEQGFGAVMSCPTQPLRREKDMTGAQSDHFFGSDSYVTEDLERRLSQFDRPGQYERRHH